METSAPEQVTVIRSSTRFRYGVAAIAAVYLALAVLNICRLPAINGPDEQAHLRYVQVLRTQHAMPLLTRFVSPGQEALEGEQAQHPPLYYAILAACSYVLPDLSSDFGIRALKLLSVLMGLIGLLATAGCARRLWPVDTPLALAAVAAVAFLPMYWVMTSLLNNTAGSLMFGGVALLLLQRASAAERVRWREWFWAGLAIALGLVAKVTAIWLLPLAAVVIWSRCRRDQSPRLRLLLTMALPLALPVLAFFGGWLAYNWTHFGVLMPERVLGRQYLPAGFATIFFLPFARNLLLHCMFVTIPLSIAAPFWLLRGEVSDATGLVLLLVYAGPPLVALAISGFRRRQCLLDRPSAQAAVLLACLVGVLVAWIVAVEAILHDWNTGLYAGRYAVDAAPACALLWTAGMQRLFPRPAIRLIALLVWLGALLAASIWVHHFMVWFFHRGW